MLTSDLRLALRALLRQPSFALVTVLMLALGIGATTAIFSIVQGVLLAPLPFSEAERLVAVAPLWRDTGRVSVAMSGPDYLDFAKQCEACEATGYYFGGEMAIRAGAEGEFARLFFVSERFFEVLRIRPHAGQLGGGPQTVAVSFEYAARRFGSPQAAVGRTVQVLERSYRISAVVPRGMAYPEKADLWAPAEAVPMNRSRTAHNYRVVARLRPGVSHEAAGLQAGAIADRLSSQYPKDNQNKSFRLLPLKEQMVGQAGTALYALLGAVGLLLLIACANAANLLLARGVARQREIAVRAALGAGRGTIIRQLALESLVLSLAACVAGVTLAYLCLDALVALSPASTPRLSNVGIDDRVLGFSAALSLLCGLVFGLAPAIHAARIDLIRSLRQGGTRGALGGGAHGFRQGIVLAQVALSFVLVLGAGLLFRSFLSLNSVERGYRTDGRLVLTASSPAANTLAGHQRAARDIARATEAAGALPGAVSAAAAMGLPNGPYGSNGAYLVEGAPMLSDWTKMPQAGFRLATPGYFTTLGIPLLRGRDFQPADQYDAPAVAVISAALARQSFPGEDPIGKRIKCGLDRDVWMTVVGVVGDIRTKSPGTPPQPELYMPLEQHPFMANDAHIVVRTAVPPESLAAPARAAIARVNPAIAVKHTSMRQMFDDAIAIPRFQAFLTTLFAVIAVGLAIAGVYSLMSYRVAQRTSEFGLRVALGAQRSDILALTMRQGLALILGGLLVGGVLSAALTRFLQSMLFGVQPYEVTAFLGAAAFLLAAAGAAVLVPAMRATRLDPVTALREE